MSDGPSAPRDDQPVLLRAEVGWQGTIIRAGSERLRHPDGREVTRDKVWHPGAVGILAVDRDCVWLTRQPREAVRLSASLEIPAGKLDVEGEQPLATARRELIEEIGIEAGTWRELYSCFSSPGFCDERVWIFLATDLRAAAGGASPEEDERIEIVRWPLSELDGAIADCADAKSLIALLHLRTMPWPPTG
jgi:8-oxo-dGTP pyrophosphatase MutT (NUDIX family)